MNIVHRNLPKIKQQKTARAKRRKAQGEKRLDALIKLLPIFAKLLSDLIPLIILLGTHYHWL